MARVIPGPLATELAKSGRISGECLILAARDGERARFTTLDRAQTIDLGLGAGDEVCATGMVLSALTLAVGLDASFAEVTGKLGDALTRAEVDGGKWNDAEAWLVGISPGVAGWMPLLGGHVRDARCEGAGFVLEIRNQGDQLSQTLGAEINAYCRWRFGSTECGAVPVTAAATVTAVAAGALGAMRFTVSYAGAFVDDYFNQGEIEFLTGVLTGVTADSLFDFISGGAGVGTLVLWEPLSAPPGIGDTLTITQGCAKTRADCIVHQGDALRFGGFPDAVGSDQLLRAPNPGSSA